MELLDFLVSNLPLLCLSVAMLFIAFFNLISRRKESMIFIVFTITMLFLALVVYFENYSKTTGNVILGTIFTSIGYIVRPFSLYLFVLLANLYAPPVKHFSLIWAIPLFVNTIFYIFPFFFNTTVGRMVFYYSLNSDGTASFNRGGVLNFVSHAVCLVYLVYLIYISVVRLHSAMNRREGIVILVCVIFIFLTVAAEMIGNRNDLLNMVSEVCAMIFYVFVTSLSNKEDVLTKLFNRRAFYEDTSRFSKTINGVIQIDMNGLKFLNDNFGHGAGDAALVGVAAILKKSIGEYDNMYVYRLSGDEFVILMLNGTDEELNGTIDKIRNNINNSDYSIAVGGCFTDNDISFEEAMKIAEKEMYDDKNRYYSESGHDRRKS